MFVQYAADAIVIPATARLPEVAMLPAVAAREVSPLA
jgi:hypothetical protein